MLIEMAKPSARKRKKQKARERIVAKRKCVETERRRYAESFPEFRFVTNNAPTEFVELIRRAVNKINFRDPSQFQAWEKSFFKRAKQTPQEALTALIEAKDQRDPAALHLIAVVGELVFSLIPREQLLQWIPFHDVQFIPTGRTFTVHFRSLEQQKSDGGTIYFSRHKPSLKIGSDEQFIGWSRHAIERTCERLSAKWDTYLGMGNLFAFFDQCCRFDLVTLHDGQLAFTFYDKCVAGFSKRQFVPEVLGTDDGRSGYYFRVGYCPAVIEGDFIKAMTLLVPGYRGTPEYGAILQSKLSRDEKEEMKERTSELTMAHLQKTNDFSLIKWFHENSVPQVIHTDERIYMPPV